MRDSQRANGFWHFSVFRRKSLVVHTILLLLAAGVCVWLVSDYFYHRALDDMTVREYDQDARRHALSRQQQLNGHLSAFSDKVRLNATYQPFLDHFISWTSAANTPVITPARYRSNQASWLEPAGGIVRHIPVDYALVFDDQHRLLAIYDNKGGGDPDIIREIDSKRLQPGYEKMHIEQIAGSEFLLVSSGIIIASQKRGQLVFMTRFNNELFDRLTGEQPAFIQHAVVDVDNGNIIAGNLQAADQLLFPDTSATPSVLRLVHQGPVLSVYNKRNIAYMVWLDTVGLANQNQPIIAFDRRQRLITIAVLIFLLTGIVWRLRQRLLHLQSFISSYSERLGIQKNLTHDGDEIETIKNHIASFASEMSAETSALEYQAMHDGLTNLPNRTLMLERLNMEISKCEKNKTNMALLIIDLDHFKEVNDTLGHQIGDRLLQEVGRRLVALLRPADMVARLGGDEFAIILSAAHRAQVIAVCKKIFRVMEKPVILDGTSLRIGMSIGASICPEHGHNTSLLMQHADVAMYESKRHQSGFSIYNSKKDKNNTSRLGLSNALHEAIENDELLLEYQPLIDMKSNEVSCVEALVRWQHPDMGLVQPDEFISLAEQNGVIRPLTLWVIDHALAQTVRWKKAGLQLKLSINLSVRCLQDRALPFQVEKLVGKHKVSPDQIVLEITESAIMSDPITARRIMRRLSNMGFLLSIDDFGTGYSSLSYLKQLPVDEVKIDKSFVIDMNTNKNDAAIVQATIDLAHNLGMKVVAEGVENNQVMETIRILGCDTAQGYFISKPAAASDLVCWIRARDVQKESQTQALEACLE